MISSRLDLAKKKQKEPRTQRLTSCKKSQSITVSFGKSQERTLQMSWIAASPLAGDDLRRCGTLEVHRLFQYHYVVTVCTASSLSVIVIRIGVRSSPPMITEKERFLVELKTEYCAISRGLDSHTSHLEKAEKNLEMNTRDCTHLEQSS